MACKACLIVYAIVQFAAFVLVTVGTPIDMYRRKNEDTWGNTPCLTMWGEKTKCYSTKYNTRTNDLYTGCTGRRDRFRAIEACSIISIVLMGVACLFGFIALCCCGCLRWICMVLNILGLGASCTVWAIVVEAFLNSSKINAPALTILYCGKFKDFYKLGAGFALFVAGCGLDLINIFILMMPC